MNIYNAHSAEGYYFVVAWFNSFTDFNGWAGSPGVDAFTNYYVDIDMSIYGLYKSAFMPDNIYVPKNILIDRDGNARATDNTIIESEWEGWVEELL